MASAPSRIRSNRRPCHPKHDPSRAVRQGPPANTGTTADRSILPTVQPVVFRRCDSAGPHQPRRAPDPRPVVPRSGAPDTVRHPLPLLPHALCAELRRIERTPRAMTLTLNLTHPWVLLLLPLAVLPLLRARSDTLLFSHLPWLPADPAGRIVGWLRTACAVLAIVSIVLGLAGPGRPQTEVVPNRPRCRDRCAHRS